MSHEPVARESVQVRQEGAAAQNIAIGNVDDADQRERNDREQIGVERWQDAEDAARIERSHIDRAAHLLFVQKKRSDQKPADDEE